MERAVEYYYAEEELAHKKHVYVVLTYGNDLESPIDISVFKEKYHAESHAMRATGSVYITNANNDDVPALSYVIGERLIAEIHRKRLR